MTRKLISITTLMAALAYGLIGSSIGLAGGDKNAYNNPAGQPPQPDQTPYVNTGDGRMMVFCEADEVLVITPVDLGSIEATCKAATE